MICGDLHFLVLGDFLFFHFKACPAPFLSLCLFLFQGCLGGAALSKFFEDKIRNYRHKMQHQNNVTELFVQLAVRRVSEAWQPPDPTKTCSESEVAIFGTTPGNSGSCSEQLSNGTQDLSHPKTHSLSNAQSGGGPNLLGFHFKPTPGVSFPNVGVVPARQRARLLSGFPPPSFADVWLQSAGRTQRTCVITHKEGHGLTGLDKRIDVRLPTRLQGPETSQRITQQDTMQLGSQLRLGGKLPFFKFGHSPDFTSWEMPQPTPCLLQEVLRPIDSMKGSPRVLCRGSTKGSPKVSCCVFQRGEALLEGF